MTEGLNHMGPHMDLNTKTSSLTAHYVWGCPFTSTARPKGNPMADRGEMGVRTLTGGTIFVAGVTAV